MILSIFFIGSCQKENKVSEEISKIPSENYSRRNIDLNEFQNKFFNSNLNRGLTDPFSTIANKGGNNYITHVNTDRIVEFSNDDITTFTFNVVTADADHESFTNLIYFEKNNQVGDIILRYSPTTSWLTALGEGTKLPFSGTLSLMSAQGEVIQTNDIIEGVPQGRDTTACTFSATPIWIDCYGASCPCPDGNGSFGGWEISISCGPSTGGGGDPVGDGGDPGGGNGSTGDGGIGDSGNGQQEGSDGNLPTDPLEWSLFNKLNTLRAHPDDYFYFYPPVDIDEGLIFATFEDFRDFISDYEIDDDEVIQDQDGTFNTFLTLTNNLGPDIKIIVNSTLQNNSAGQQYALNNLDAFLIGNNYLGYFIDVKNFYFNGINVNDWVEIEVYYELGINGQIGPLPYYFSKTKHMRLEFDIYTGGFRNYTELD